MAKGLGHDKASEEIIEDRGGSNNVGANTVSSVKSAVIASAS